ncbi:MAG: phosphoglucosamine mutase, partial [Deltaproteobacteria bacterium]|nr:phosphoglucosamine mutase [Deltaproteobacteria bacterium]
TLVSLCEKVKSSGAAVGFAQDPDADRLAIVDENGVYIGEEYTLALATRLVLSKIKGSVAANLSTSRMIDDIAAETGCEVIRTPVGEAHVAQAMVENNCVIGGEGNGGIIDLRVGPVRDSFVGMALILQLMADTGKSLSELASEVGGYTIYKSKYPADKQQADQIVEQAKAIFPNAKINTSDGCRFDLDDGWIHIRISNTEPIMRVIIETKSSETAGQYTQAVEKICRTVLNN